MISIEFMMAFVGAAIAMILGIFIYAEISEDIGGSFTPLTLISNGTAGGLVIDSPLYACSSESDQITLIDKLTGLPISSVLLPNADDCLGITVDPTTGIFYVLGNKQAGNPGSILSTVDPTTGVATAVGNVTMSCDSDCASMAFDGDGVLWLVRNTFYNDIYKIDKTNGAELSVCRPSTPGDGGVSLPSILAFNYDNNKMYRTWTNTSDLNNSSRLEVIDPTTCVSSELVTITGDLGYYNTDGVAKGFAYNTVDGLFYMSGGLLSFGDHYTLTTGGLSTKLADDVNSLTYIGLAFPHITEAASPPVYSGGVPTQFTKTDGIAMTVLAIIPVTLFFGLFTLFNGRNEF